MKVLIFVVLMFHAGFVLTYDPDNDSEEVPQLISAAVGSGRDKSHVETKELPKIDMSIPIKATREDAQGSDADNSSHNSKDDGNPSKRRSPASIPSAGVVFH